MALKNIYFDRWSEFVEFAQKVNEIIAKQQAMTESLDQCDELYEEYRDQKVLA